MGKVIAIDPRQRLVAFLERSGLGEALTRIETSMKKRGVLVENQNRFTKRGPHHALRIRRWLDGFEHTFRVVVRIDKDGLIYVKINNLEPFTEATLPTGTGLHELLIDQFGKPIKKQVH